MADGEDKGKSGRKHGEGKGKADFLAQAETRPTDGPGAASADVGLCFAMPAWNGRVPRCTRQLVASSFPFSRARAAAVPAGTRCDLTPCTIPHLTGQQRSWPQGCTQS